MSNLFEERLKQRIHQVFDHYEDNSADLGWRELQKKLPPHKDRQPVLAWLSTAAALLIIGIAVWFSVNIKEQKPQLAKLKPVTKYSEPSLDVSPLLPATKDQARGREVHAYSHNTKLVQLKKESAANQNYPLTNSYQSSGSSPSDKNPEIIQPVPLATINSAIINHAVAINTSSTLAANTSSSAIDYEQSQGLELGYNKASLMNIASQADDKKKTESVKNKRVSFGVFAGSFVNYSGGSENKLNMGAGFTSEIKLTKNLNLSTGVSLAQNDLSYKKNEVPRVAAASFKNSTNASNHVSAMKVISYNLDRYDASLLGLDIPVNLKYTLSGQKNQFYLAAGISSGTFINEAYTYHYSSSGPTGSHLYSSLQSSPEENYNKTEKRGVSDFDFAKMLNISLGIGYPVGKNSTLILEPFLKYPLKTVGDENLRFGAEGINLKFNFQTLKLK